MSCDIKLSKVMRSDLSLAQNIDELLFSEGGKLRDEFNYLYASIFKNAEPHLKVVEALSEKKSGLMREEIIAATGLNIEEYDFMQAAATSAVQTNVSSLLISILLLSL